MTAALNKKVLCFIDEYGTADSDDAATLFRDYPATLFRDDAATLGGGLVSWF
jgi:hypothetical protein